MGSEGLSDCADVRDVPDTPDVLNASGGGGIIGGGTSRHVVRHGGTSLLAHRLMCGRHQPGHHVRASTSHARNT